jgi:hypothetical protein
VPDALEILLVVTKEGKAAAFGYIRDRDVIALDPALPLV